MSSRGTSARPRFPGALSTGREDGRAAAWWFLLLVAVLSGCFALWLFAVRSTAPDPATVHLPEPTNVDQTEQYLTHRGRPLVSLSKLANRFEEAGSDWCGPAVLRELEDLGTPAHMAALAAAVPDETLADMWLMLLRSLTIAIATCDSETDDDEAAAADVQFAAVLLRRSLAAHGLER